MRKNIYVITAEKQHEIIYVSYYVRNEKQAIKSFYKTPSNAYYTVTAVKKLIPSYSEEHK